jgi:CheY-like chemotaxis protein
MNSKQNSTILIVDDQPGAQEVLKGLLINQGYNLVVAGNGPDALATAAVISPDIVLLDVMMPEMDGFEVCRRFRADPVLAQVPVILVTALDDQDSIIQGIEAGADDFISKPFNHAELKARVQNVSRLNRYRRLQAEQEKFEWDVEKAGDGYLIIDDDDVIQYANSQARIYLGLPDDEESEALKKSFLEIAGRQYNFQPEEAWETWPAPALLTDKRPSPRYLVQPESATQHAFWLKVDVLETPTGSRVGPIVKLYDVTSQMNMHHDMWEFQSLVAHKLRTPLGGVVGGLELLVEDLEFKELLTGDMASVFNLVFTSAKDLKNDILNIFQYISTTKSTLPGVQVDLAQINPMISQIRTDLEIANVTVNNQIDPDHSYVSLSDQSVELILREIFNNSKKFHPEQSPTIEVTLLQTDNGNITLQIADDGINLSADKLNRVWIPYYQAEKYFTGQIDGMGLGLSRVASLVWSAGGSVSLTNRETGPGIVVSLTLPTSAAEDKV